MFRETATAAEDFAFSYDPHEIANNLFKFCLNLLAYRVFQKINFTQ